jgi:hypothetical protein
MSDLAEKLKKHELLTKSATVHAIDHARKFGSTSHEVNSKNADISDAEFDLSLIPPPKPHPKMFYGIVGEVAKCAADGTEINPVSAAATYLSFLSANIGRNTYLMINNRCHHVRLFTAHIGRSGRGGKGDAQEPTHRIRQKIVQIDQSVVAQTHIGGLSSTEGLVQLIADPTNDTQGVIDKRLWVIENEFANVLSQNRREGNTLSSSLRRGWDGDDIKPAIKNKPVWVTDPHIAIHCCITPSELKKMLTAGDISNGFANRFLIFWAENIGYVPFPNPISDDLIHQFALRTIDIIKFAKGDYPRTKNGQKMWLTQSAVEFYQEIYRGLRSPFNSELLSELLQRRAPYALRLAMEFALTDMTYEIDVCHLEAALAWVNYSTDSVKFIFSEKTQDAKLLETRRNSTKILEFLRTHPQQCASLTEISNHCFKKNVSSEGIRASLQYLLSDNPPLIEQHVVEPVNGTGRAKTIIAIRS